MYYGECCFSRHKRGIWRVPVSGGTETRVLDKEIQPFHWDVTDGGVYFIDGGGISFVDVRTGQVTALAPVHAETGFDLSMGLNVAPDGTWLAYGGGVKTRDIMLIDDFR